PCHVLRAADVDRLLGGPTQSRSTRTAASDAGSTCALDRTDGSRAISLTLVPAPAGAGYVDAARQEAQSSRKMQIEEEPGLGVGAFSSTSGWTVIVVAQRHDAAMVLALEGVAVDRTELRRFAARIRASLPPGWIVRVQAPLALDDESAPEPDVAVVRGRHADYRSAHPTRAALIVEVAESSLTFDRVQKGSLYARAGIVDYWIVNLVD